MAEHFAPEKVPETSLGGENPRAANPDVELPGAPRCRAADRMALPNRAGELAGHACVSPQPLHQVQHAQIAAAILPELGDATTKVAQHTVDSAAGTPVGPGLQADESGHHRVKAVDGRRGGVPQVHLQERDELRAGNPSQLPAHMLEAVELLPGGQVEGEPLLARHARMIHDRMERVVGVEVSVHRCSAGDVPRMVLRARQGRQHEERGDVGANLVPERPEVVPYGIGAVVWEPDDVSDVGQNSGGVPGLDQRCVVCDAVLSFPSVVQTLGVQTLHADEDLKAPRPFGQRDEVRNAVGEDVDLHQKRHRHVAFLAQADQLLENRTPARIAREVVVGEEEVVGSQIGAAGLDGGRDGDRVAGAHRPPLHVDDRAERAGERTTAAGVQGCEVPIDELPGQASVEPRHRSVRQGGLSIDEVVDG